MLHVALEHFLIWIREQWGEQSWADYFEREYLCKKRVPRATFGRDELIWAHWWSGAGFHEAWDCPGHPGSQQVAEQANFKLKKDIREQAPNKQIRTHQDVAMAVLGCLKTWLSPIQDVDANTDAPVTLMAPTGLCSWSDRPSQMGGC